MRFKKDFFGGACTESWDNILGNGRELALIILGSSGVVLLPNLLVVVTNSRCPLAEDADGKGGGRLSAHSWRSQRSLLSHLPHWSTREESPGSSVGQLRFNPTVRHVVINEHKDVTFNCSIKVPQELLRPDAPGISLWKDGRELHVLDRIASSHFEIPDEEEVAMTSTFR